MRHPLVYLVEAADDICYQIMDLEDAFKLGILSYAETKNLYLGFYDAETDKKYIENINATLTRVTDKNEQISYLRAGIIGKLIYECIGIFTENQDYILAGSFENSLIGSLKNKQAEALNLNEKIYKRFYQFEDFQFVFLVNEMYWSEVEQLKNALREGVGTDLSKWNFISVSKENMRTHFESLQTPFELDESASTPYVFIIDKDSNLRGRNDDEKEGTLYGFDARSVAQINKKMIDDVKVILAEYRLALKIYNNNREK